MAIAATVRAVSRNKIPRPPLKAPITITPSAKKRLLSLYALKSRETASTTPITRRPMPSTPPLSSTTPQPPSSPISPIFLKVSVRTKGCSGNAYTMDWVDAKQKLDESLPIGENFQLLIDSKALFTLLGSQMDYVEDKISAGFVFENPNVKETCGCGLSFIV